jgi:hypothetical protein
MLSTAMNNGGQWLATPLLLAVLSFPAWTSDLPDPVITPGAINPGITQENIRQTVCVKGYTKKIRPPAHLTNKLKKQQIRAYGYTDTNLKLYEEDHLIALEIGGAPDDPLNLWPQPRNSEWGAEKKDQLENVLHKKICAREIPLAEAQRAMATNWIEAWNQYVSSRQGSYEIAGNSDDKSNAEKRKKK